MDPDAIYADRRLFGVERRQLLETLAVMTALGVRPVRLPGAAVPWLARAIRLPARWAARFCDGSSAERAAASCRLLRLHVQMAGQGPSTEQTESGLDERRGPPASAGKLGSRPR